MRSCHLALRCGHGYQPACQSRLCGARENGRGWPQQATTSRFPPGLSCWRLELEAELGDASGAGDPRLVVTGPSSIFPSRRLSLPWSEGHGWVSLAAVSGICPAVPRAGRDPAGSGPALKARPLSRDPSLVLRSGRGSFPGGAARQDAGCSGALGFQVREARGFSLSTAGQIWGAH